jgi:deoxyadenosine/deoxycytidine kinase
MIRCPHCEWPFSSLPELQTHMEVKHDENVPAQLIALYLDMKAFPDDLRKRSVYFEALADARLSDYYSLHDELKEVSQRIEHVRRISDVGLLFDGADHLNEYTHEENEKHLTGALDKIHAIVTGKIALEDV